MSRTDRFDATEKALRKLFNFRNNIEVLGEWEALEMNRSSRKQVRAQYDEIVAEVRAVLDAIDAERKANENP